MFIFVIVICTRVLLCELLWCAATKPTANPQLVQHKVSHCLSHCKQEVEHAAGFSALSLAPVWSLGVLSHLQSTDNAMQSTLPTTMLTASVY